MSPPRHIAIVMDGNGRWAQMRGYPRIYGHVRGCRRVRAVVEEAQRQGVQALTLFAFSTENWNRPEAERSALWKLLKKYLVRELGELRRQNIRLQIIGELGRLDSDLQQIIATAEAHLAHNTGLRLSFAVSYGGRSEILRASRLMAEDCLQGRIQTSMIDEEVFGRYLLTAQLEEYGEVDLFIRTSGKSA